MDRPTLDALGSISYEASDLSGEDSSEAWVQGLAAALDAAVSRLQQLLTPKNYDALVSLVLTDVAKRACLVIAPKAYHGTACESVLAQLQNALNSLEGQAEVSHPAQAWTQSWP